MSTILAQLFPTLTQGLLGLLVLLAVAGLGGGVRLYGDVRAIDERTKNLDQRTGRVENSLDSIETTLGTIREDMASVKTHLDGPETDDSDGDEAPTTATDGGVGLGSKADGDGS